LQNYLNQINNLFAQRGQSLSRHFRHHGCDNQLRALVDLAHVWGIGVLFDVVYNHAAGMGQ